MSDSSLNLFVTSAAIAFAVFGGTRATETLRLFRARDQDYRHLNSVARMSIVLIVASLVPLVLSDVKNSIQISSLTVAAIVLVFCAIIIYSILKGTLQIINILQSALIVVVSLIIAAALCWNYYHGSITLYKSAVFVGIMLLLQRFQLVLHEVISRP